MKWLIICINVIMIMILMCNNIIININEICIMKMIIMYY